MAKKDDGEQGNSSFFSEILNSFKEGVVSIVKSNKNTSKEKQCCSINVSPTLLKISPPKVHTLLQKALRFFFHRKNLLSISIF